MKVVIVFFAVLVVCTAFDFNFEDFDDKDEFEDLNRCEQKICITRLVFVFAQRGILQGGGDLRVYGNNNIGRKFLRELRKSNINWHKKNGRWILSREKSVPHCSQIYLTSTSSLAILFFEIYLNNKCQTKKLHACCKKD